MLLLALIACKKEEAKGPRGAPSFDEVERAYVLGDNAASNPSWSTGYAALLGTNDDVIFPAFAGKDLDSLDIPLTRLDRGGDSYGALADLDEPWCTCTGCDDCLDHDQPAPLVIVELGVNDLVALALRALNDPAVRADPQPHIDAFETQVGLVLDKVPYEGERLLAVSNVPDPTDGEGNLAELVTTLFPVAGADEVTPELALSVIDGFNDAIASQAEAHDAVLIDIHDHFLGHGYNFDVEDNPSYDADDETNWYRTVIDPNLRGAHEIRRLLWNTLAEDAIADIPTDLPVDGSLGLPDVPDEGWADVLVDANILPVDEDTPNVASNAEVILGPPGGGTGDTVAMGPIGAWIVVELTEAATDGEGDDLVVLEFGAQSGGTPEPYRVLVSDAPDGPWTVVGDGIGERSFDLAGIGVDPVPYVRLESLAQVADILGGLGSPYYPGPEMDAVGAVYPE